jgi:hypothetical protein
MSAVAKDQDLRKLLEGLAMKWLQLAVDLEKPHTISKPRRTALVLSALGPLMGE